MCRTMTPSSPLEPEVSGVQCVWRDVSGGNGRSPVSEKRRTSDERTGETVSVRKDLWGVFRPVKHSENVQILVLSPSGWEFLERFVPSICVLFGN